MAKKKKAESIWTKDITPGVSAFMQKDVTTLFDHPIWTKDITHVMVGTLAVFGLVVSSVVTTLGVAAVGVNVQLALAGEMSGSGQSAALMLGEGVEHPHMMPATSSAVTNHIPKSEDQHLSGMGSTTLGMMGTSSTMVCPKIAKTVFRGSRDTATGTSTGDISELQRFIAKHFNLSESDVVSGYFGSTTASYLQKFQAEQGIVQAPVVGPLTRAAIARLCNPSGKDPVTTKGDLNRDGGEHSSTTPMGDNRENHGDMRYGSTTMGSTTMPMRPRGDDMMRNGSSTVGSSTMPTIEHRKLPPPLQSSDEPVPTTTSLNTLTPVSNESNAASAIEAVAEIGDGFAKLTSAYLSVFGL